MVTKQIKIAENLNLPLDAITQTFAQIGRKGAGKTYLASMIAEQMLDVQAQVIIIDPIGNWWGLRVASNGKSKGKDIFIIGGTHGDVSVVPESGKEIAKLLAEKNISVVLDVSEFRKNERKKFITDFAEEFYHLKKTRNTPVHVFLEEAQKFVPQRITKDEARMLGAWEDIVRLGRNYGIGCSLISQRPQSVNKEVLSQVECLFVLQITGLHERKALEGWVQEAGADRKIIGFLPSLSQGEGYVWSPSWLRTFQKVKFNKKTTFDTSATPKLGEARKAAEISKMDIDKLKKYMSNIIEDSKIKLSTANDYKEEIVRLKKQLRQTPKPSPIADINIDRIIKQKMKEREKEHEKAIKINTQIIQKVTNELSNYQEKMEQIGHMALGFSKVKIPKNIPSKETPIPKPKLSISLQPNVQIQTNSLDRCARKIYSFLFANSDRTFTKKQVAFMTKYRISGSFNNSIYSLTSRGLVEKNSDILSLGSVDSSIATEPQEKFSKELFTSKLNRCERAIFQILWENPERDYSKQELVELTGYVLSGSFNNAIYRLHSLNFSIKTGKSYKLHPEVLELK